MAAPSSRRIRVRPHRRSWLTCAAAILLIALTGCGNEAQDVGESEDAAQPEPESKFVDGEYDPRLEGLASDCIDDGNEAACWDLFHDAPTNSEYEALGFEAAIKPAAEDLAPPAPPETEEAAEEAPTDAPGDLGLGTSIAAWESQREGRSSFGDLRAFGPDVAGGPMYDAVFGDPTVMSYERYFPPDTSAEQQEQIIVADELPQDATEIDRAADGTCVLLLYESSELASDMGFDTRALVALDPLPTDRPYAVIMTWPDPDLSEAFC